MRIIHKVDCVPPRRSEDDFILKNLPFSTKTDVFLLKNQPFLRSPFSSKMYKKSCVLLPAMLMIFLLSNFKINKNVSKL